VVTAHGNFYPTLSVLDDRVVEVFARLGKAGGCDSSYLEAIGRLVSLALQYRVPEEEVIGQLRGVTCHPYMIGGAGENLGPVDALGRELEGAVASLAAKRKDAPVEDTSMEGASREDEPKR